MSIEKIIVPVSSKQNFENVFDNLQITANTNLERRLKRLIGEYGIQCSEKNGTVTSNEFEVGAPDSTHISIQSGKALTESFNFLEATSITTKTLSSGAGDYTVLAKSKVYTDTPVKVVDGFAYDDSTQTRDTRQHESVEFNIVASGTAAGTDEVYLANISWDGNNPATVYDRRNENVLSLSDAVIDDSNVVKKDRDSTIAASISFDGNQFFLNKIRVGDSTSPTYTIDTSGIIRTENKIMSDTYTSDDADDVTITPRKTAGKVVLKSFDDGGRVEIQDHDGNTLGYFDKNGTTFTKKMTSSQLVSLSNVLLSQTVTFSDDGENITLSGVSNEELRLGVGTLGASGAGVKVLTENVEPVQPLNLRVYDIDPYNDVKRRPVAEITFKWFWEELTGQHYSADGTNTIRIEGELSGADALDVSANELQDLYMYCPNFTSSDNKYKIKSNQATSGGATVITLEDAYSNESATSANPAKIITDGDTVEMKFIPVIDGTAQNYKAFVRTIDPDDILEQTFAQTLVLDNTYRVLIRAKKGDQTSDWKEMAAGSYDPDHTTSGTTSDPDQSVETYTKPLTVTLPDLNDTGADITLSATQFGFHAVVTGWEVSGKPDETAHLYEYAYTTQDTLNWNDYDKTTHITTSDKFITVNSDYQRLYQVGVRPLQNLQAVGTPVVKQINSGGGGVAPGDQAILNAVEIDVRTYSGTMSSLGGSLWQLTSIKTPAGSTTDVTSAAAAMYLSTRQSVLKDSNGNEFIIVPTFVYDTGNDIVVNLQNISGDSSTVSAGTFEINTTQKGRKVKVLGNIQIEYDSVLGYYDSDFVQGADVNDPAILRVAQNTNEGKTHADLLDIFEDDTAYEFDTDFSIRNAYGALGLLLDLWDPSETGANNTASVKGRITLYMRPRIKPRDPGEQTGV